MVFGNMLLSANTSSFEVKEEGFWPGWNPGDWGGWEWPWGDQNNNQSWPWNNQDPNGFPWGNQNN